MADTDLLDMHSVRRTGRQPREYIEECKDIVTWRNCPGILIIHTGAKINKIYRLLLYYKQQTNGSLFLIQ